MERRRERGREPQLEDAVTDHPFGALAALVASVAIASCFFGIFIRSLWAIAPGIPVGIVYWLFHASLIAKDPDNNEWWGPE